MLPTVIDSEFVMKCCVPTYKNIMFTDWSVFLTIFGYIGFIGFAFCLFVKAEFPFAGYGVLDWIEVVVYFSLAAAVTTPFGLWWCFVTKRTFKKGVLVKAKITEYFGTKGPYIGIYYKFNFDGKEYAQSSTVLNKKKIRGLVNSENISIVFDEKRKISFIYELYCDH